MIIAWQRTWERMLLPVGDGEIWCITRHSALRVLVSRAPGRHLYGRHQAEIAA
jgi:hypothetical protein